MKAISVMQRTAMVMTLIGALLAMAMAGGRDAKVTICHVGSDGNPRTIEVSERAAFGWGHLDQVDDDDESQRRVNKRNQRSRSWKSIKDSQHSRAKMKRARLAGHLAAHKQDYLGACEFLGETTETTVPAPTTTIGTTVPAPTTTTTKAPPENLLPVVAFDVTFVATASGSTAHLDGAASYDPEGVALTYSWTIETAGVFGSTFESSTAPVWDSSGVYASGRSIVVTLEVSDGTYVNSVSRTVSVP